MRMPQHSQSQDLAFGVISRAFCCLVATLLSTRIEDEPIVHESPVPLLSFRVAIAHLNSSPPLLCTNNAFAL